MSFGRETGAARLGGAGIDFAAEGAQGKNGCSQEVVERNHDDAEMDCARSENRPLYDPFMRNWLGKSNLTLDGCTSKLADTKKRTELLDGWALSRKGQPVEDGWSQAMDEGWFKRTEVSRGRNGRLNIFEILFRQESSWQCAATGVFVIWTESGRYFSDLRLIVGKKKYVGTMEYRGSFADIDLRSAEDNIKISIEFYSPGTNKVSLETHSQLLSDDSVATLRGRIKAKANTSCSGVLSFERCELSLSESLWDVYPEGTFANGVWLGATAMFSGIWRGWNFKHRGLPLQRGFESFLVMSMLIGCYVRPDRVIPG